MPQEIRLVSDGTRFYQVQSTPTPSPSPFLDSPPEIEIDRPEEPAPPQSPPTPIPNTPTAPTAPPSPSPPTPSDTDTTVQPTTPTHDLDQPLSETAARAQVGEYILSAPWFVAHEPEPTADAPGVPACAMQLASPGESVWTCFFSRVRRGGETMYKCVACEHEAKRVLRAIGHQRTEWEHKPYACVDTGW
jgi:hypothetical protein